jgi:hypothetical protein
MNIQPQCLLPHQRKAQEYVRQIAVLKRAAARNTIREILARAGLNESAFDDAMKSVHAHAQVVTHFHPERISMKGQSVAETLLQEGVYKSQFETGLSSGSPTAFPGGERDLWEQRLFGGAYQAAGVSLADRPKYGALEIMYHPDGASPRFGSCYLVLRADVSKRSTFTFGGSQEDDALERTGTLDSMESVMAALFSEVAKGQGALGVDNLTVTDLLAQLTHGLASPFRDSATRPLGRALDSFIEVQIHGTVNLGEDVERLVADPSFRGGPIEVVLRAIGAKYHLLLNWHPGFILPVAKVPDYFRGYAVKPLARRIAGQGILDAAKIGAAANSLQQAPEAWKEWGNYSDILTLFRRLWHLLVLYGMPREATQ